ncbi:hypothetical protein CMV_029221 [Castanea mollissima]|uniref:Oleosin n=1 Tax=Castanea mollissima TaxID=60419 RepID=A0A8J4Q6W1_9ROSI|nr:hypothetical protein CMV_029221 [Castanea mollissima]
MKSHYQQRGVQTIKVQVLAVVLALLTVGGTLFALSGLTLLCSVIGLAVSTPLFIIFSPVLVPAAIVIGLAVTGFLCAEALGLTGLSSLSWVMMKTKEVGQEIESKAQERRRT